MIEGRDERATGKPNTIYDLSSVLFHALQGGASYDQFVRDAEEAGDEELAGFFRRVREEDSDRAAEARRLLAGRTLTATRDEAAVSGASPRPEPSGAYPGTEPITEEAPSRAVERETGTAREEPAPLGDIPPGISRTEQASSGMSEKSTRREEDKDLVHKAQDYLLGEDREKDYLRGEDRER